MHKLAIVILNWNGSDMMRKYLPSVIANSIGDVIVADNASTDDSLQMLANEFPTLRTIVLDKNYGFAEGYNRALAQLKDEYEYLLLLNSDVEIRQKDWDKILLDYMDSHPECAACMPKLLKLTSPNPSEGGGPQTGSYKTESNTESNPVSNTESNPDGITPPLEGTGEVFEYAGASGGFLDKYGYPFCRGRIMDTVEQDNGQYDTIVPILWATGACLLVRSSDYFNAGGLDSHFFAHMEEIDLCWRLRNMGRSIVCIPQSTAYHLGGASLNYGNPRKTFLNFRNSLWMLYKNLPESELRSVLTMRFILDMVAALKFLLTLQGSHALAILRANREFYSTRKQWKEERNRVQSTRKTDIIKERTNYSILFKYYVKAIKTYDKL